MERATPSDKPWAVISICEKGNFPEIATNDQMVGRLNLQFHDVDFFKNGEREDGRILFNHDQAKQVLDFYEDMKAKGVTVLYIHCLMGQCRSAGVASALSKMQDNDDHVWFRTKRPNMRVHSTILQVASDRGLI
jgi:predicted protein tyrosine phosphatase